MDIHFQKAQTEYRVLHHGTYTYTVLKKIKKKRKIQFGRSVK